MSVFLRLRRMMSANVHELIERVEEPTALLKQSLRDVDRQVAATLDAAVRVAADEKLLARQIAQQERRVAQATSAARAAVARGDDGAARTALKDRAQQRHVLDTLTGEANHVAVASSRLRGQLEQLQNRKREAQSRLTSLIARQRAAKAGQLAVREMSGVQESAALTAFDDLAERVERNELELAARLELSPSAGPSPPSDDPDIERELNELKSETLTNG